MKQKIKRLETLHKNMKLLRVINKLNQQNVADAIHLCRSTYSTYESGAKTPDLLTINTLANFYQIDIDTLIYQDISRSELYRSYLKSASPELTPLLQQYRKLPILSQKLILERIRLLLEWEASPLLAPLPLRE